MTGTKRWFALIVLCAGALMIILDGTIVTVALPAIQEDLGFTQSGLAWVVSAYLIPFGGLLLLSGRLGDLVGRKRTFIAGLVLFTVASLLCALAVNAGMLVAARFLQGVGGAVATAGILGMIVTMFPDARERTTAISVYAFVGAAGASIGLLSGGLLVQWAAWNWIFLINVPIGVVAAVLAARVLPGDAGIGLRNGADLPGAALVTAGLMVGGYAIVAAADHGWLSWPTLGGGVAALVLLAGFVARQAAARTPLMPLRLFTIREVSGANTVQLLVIAGMMGFQFVTALYLQRVLGFGPAVTGLAFLPTALTIGVLSLTVSGRLINRLGGRTVLLSGTALLGIGLALLARVPADGDYWIDVLPVLLLLSVGAAMVLPSVTTLAMAGADERDAGVVSGIANTSQQVGGALGTAVLASLSTSRTAAAVDLSRAEALTAGYQLAFGIGAGLMVVALLVGLVVLPRRARTPEPVTV